MRYFLYIFCHINTSPGDVLRVGWLVNIIMDLRCKFREPFLIKIVGMLC